MSNLLDFPIELFRTVIEIAVEHVGLRESVRLRQVNKIFNEEVLRAFETLLVFHDTLNYACPDFKARHNHEYGTALVPFMARFLSRRPHTDQAEFWKIFRAKYSRGCEPAEVNAPWRLNISTFLHHLLDELQVPKTDRYEALYILCSQIDDCQAFESDAAGANSSVPGIVMGVLRGFKPVYFESLDRHLLPAAILLKLPNIYEPLLDEPIEKLKETRWGSHFGSPIYAAITSRQHDLAKRLLHLFDREDEQPLFKPLSAAVKSGDIDMVRLTLGEDVGAVSTNVVEVDVKLEGLSMNHSDNSSVKPPLEAELHSAVVRAARLGETSICQHILEHIAAKKIQMESTYLAEAIYYASLYGHVDLIELFLKNGANLDMQRTAEPGCPRPIDLACWAGNAAVVEWILAQDKGPYGIPTVVAAILGNQVPVLKLLVETEGPTMSDEEWLTAIWYGIRLRCYDAVGYLIEIAKVIDVVSAFSADPTTYGTLLEVCASEGHPEAFEILLRAGMPPNAKLCQGNNGINDDWTPMMFAHASTNTGSRKVEEILEKLGVERVDMLQMPGKDLFERGYYPQGSTPMESEMPVKNSFREQNLFWARSEASAIKVNFVPRS